MLSMQQSNPPTVPRQEKLMIRNLLSFKSGTGPARIDGFIDSGILK